LIKLTYICKITKTFTEREKQSRNKSMPTRELKRQGVPRMKKLLGWEIFLRSRRMHTEIPLSNNSATVAVTLSKMRPRLRGDLTSCKRIVKSRFSRPKSSA
jgi:hypothetical protein